MSKSFEAKAVAAAALVQARATLYAGRNDALGADRIANMISDWFLEALEAVEDAPDLLRLRSLERD